MYYILSWLMISAKHAPIYLPIIINVFNISTDGEWRFCTVHQNSWCFGSVVSLPSLLFLHSSTDVKLQSSPFMTVVVPKKC